MIRLFLCWCACYHSLQPTRLNFGTHTRTSTHKLAPAHTHKHARLPYTSPYTHAYTHTHAHAGRHTRTRNPVAHSSPHTCTLAALRVRVIVCCCPVVGRPRGSRQRHCAGRLLKRRLRDWYACAAVRVIRDGCVCICVFLEEWACVIHSENLLRICVRTYCSVGH